MQMYGGGHNMLLLRQVAISPLTNTKFEEPPLVGCPQLIIHLLHLQPEEMPCHFTAWLPSHTSYFTNVISLTIKLRTILVYFFQLL